MVQILLSDHFASVFFFPGFQLNTIIITFYSCWVKKGPFFVRGLTLFKLGGNIKMLKPIVLFQEVRHILNQDLMYLIMYRFMRSIYIVKCFGLIVNICIQLCIDL
eukprot:TRINITY_DN10331_c0_g1_i3.p4 TRINITY_DN10331_c0_g1~~TRINITY_DN10331_c0_g1_i3.p4  ORF type:complete len:105 (+),score=2.93 TRINITY_DN10331_c0_g1_i3:691-1005(+)